MKRNHLEVSAFEFKTKASAIAQAERIINERNSKVNNAKKDWLEAIAKNANDETNLTNLVIKYDSLTLAIITVTDSKERENKQVVIDNVSKEIKALENIITAAPKLIEQLRIKKVANMKKLNFALWQCQPVVCVGKHGGNYVFKSVIKN